MIAPPSDLTEEQRRIVEAQLSGPYVVDAGAGTGKTFTLVHRATRLVREELLKPSELLVVTFMKKAATEIGERLMIAFSEHGIDDLPTCTTIHALGAMLIREFAYESGVSPDARGIDDLRARGVFLRAYADLLSGSLDVDLSAFPLLERSEILPRSLATLALSLKNRGIGVDEFERDALAAAESLKALPFGQLYKLGRNDRRTDLTPKTARTAAELAFEGEREARNVRVVAALFRRFDDHLDRESLLTYGDLLTRAISILHKNPRIAERLRTRWRHALVDEFQDTNPQQLALLRAIFGDDLRPVMAVGDVRQAIFEWNGADPTGIRKIADADGTRTFALSRNRRSPQQILDAAHAMLPANDLYRGDGLTAEDGPAPELCVRHELFANEATIDDSRAVEAAAIAKEILALFARGVRSKDVAILLRSRSKARLYAEELATHGIATKTHGGAGFFDAPEIADAIAWLRLLEDPLDAFALTRILEGPSFGISDGTLAKLYARISKEEDDAARTERLLTDSLPDWLLPIERSHLERFRAINRTLAASIGRPLVEALRNVLAETGIDVARTAAQPALTAQIHANIAKLVALAMGFAADRPLATISDFIGEIDEREELEIDEPEAQASRDEVAIMTVHAAKGLEWDYVFVANVSSNVFPSNGGGGGEVVALRDETTKALAMRYDVDGVMPFRWTIAKTPHDPETGVKREKPSRDEERRLFYVALTRAKRAVWVSGSGTNGKGSPYLTELVNHTVAAASGASFGPIGSEPSPRAIDAVRPPRHDGSRVIERLSRGPELFEPPAVVLSYTAIATFKTCPRLARYRYRLRVPDLRSGTVNSTTFGAEDRPPDHMDAATFGKLVHRALEFCMQDRIDGRAPDLDASLEATLDEHGLGVADDIRERVRSAVSHAVEALNDYTPIAVEREFYMTIADVQVGGFIDLIARDPDGRVTVIDYKTGHQPDSSYALQLALYCRAVRDELGDTAAAILRVADDGAQFARPALPSREAVERDVAAARTMSDDTPRTGVHCLGCAYAGPLCPEGAAAVAR